MGSVSWESHSSPTSIMVVVVVGRGGGGSINYLPIPASKRCNVYKPLGIPQEQADM